MNRKLHITILAFSIAALTAVVGLLAARSLPATPGPAPAGLDGPSAAELAALEADIQRLEAELSTVATATDTLAAVGSFAASVATRSALAAIEREIAAGAAPAAEPAGIAVEADPAEPERRARARARRQAIAMPYFSFAQGLRHTGS